MLNPSVGIRNQDLVNQDILNKDRNQLFCPYREIDYPLFGNQK